MDEQPKDRKDEQVLCIPFPKTFVENRVYYHVEIFDSANSNRDLFAMG